MSRDRRYSYLLAHALWEELQGDDHVRAAAQLPALAARAAEQGWDDVGFVVAAGQAAYEVVRPTGADPDLPGLLTRAGDAPAFVALALALTALHAGPGDPEAVLTAVGRAVALLDDPALPPLDRSTALVVCAAAYNGLSLWELVDELYDRARTLVDLGPVPGQAAALAVNRVLVRTEWAVSLLEVGADDDAATQLERALEAADQADVEALPWLWERDVEACRVVAGLLLGHDAGPLLAQAEALRQGLLAGGDLEAVALLDAARALVLHRRGDAARAHEVALLLDGLPESASTGAASFPAWVRAQVLDPTGWAGSTGTYARGVLAQRWAGRRAVLVAARSFVALERLGVDHQRLTVDVATDALTRLANRRSFEEWLVHQPAAGTWAAVLLLDLDGFKQVNDEHGHDVGDAVLRQVGQLVAAQVRPGDLAVRHGGDEFAVVHEAAPGAEAQALARGVALRAAVHAHDWQALAPGLAVRLSVGVAVGPLSEGTTHLYRRADTALYAAKDDPDGVVLAERVLRPAVAVGSP